MTNIDVCPSCDQPVTTPRSHAETVDVAAPPDVVYALVSDVTRTGEWSPICRACWWDDGAGPRPGAWFTGRNEADGVVWETHCEVVVADPGREFAFVVGPGWVRWTYTIEPAAGGSRLTESWQFTDLGLAMYHDRYGDGAHARLAMRTEQALTGIPASLEAIGQIAERDAGATRG